MTTANHEIARRFIDAMSDGDITDELVTPDFKVWIVAAGTFTKDEYQEGIAKLPKVFSGRLEFTIRSLTAEADRVVAEFGGRGTLTNGKVYRNDYLYLFRIRDGKVCFLAEYLDFEEMRKTLVAAMDELETG